MQAHELNNDETRLLSRIQEEFKFSAGDTIFDAMDDDEIVNTPMNHWSEEVASEVVDEMEGFLGISIEWEMTMIIGQFVKELHHAVEVA